MSLSKCTKVRLTHKHVQHDFQDKTVLLNFTNDRYYSLNEVGQLLFQMLQNECSIQELAIAVQEHYDVDGQTALNDVVAFIAKMQKVSLVEIV